MAGVPTEVIDFFFGITRWQQHINRFERDTWLLAAHNDTRHLVEPNP